MAGGVAGGQAPGGFGLVPAAGAVSAGGLPRRPGVSQGHGQQCKAFVRLPRGCHGGRTHPLASPGAGPGQGCEAAVGLSCRPCQNTCTGPGGAVVKRRMRNGTPGRGYLGLQVMTAQHGWAPSARVTEGGSLISLECMYTLSKHCEHGPAGFAAADTPAAERHLPAGPGPRLTPGFQAKDGTCGPIGDAAGPAALRAGREAHPCAVPPVRRGVSRCLPDPAIFAPSCRCLHQAPWRPRGSCCSKLGAAANCSACAVLLMLFVGRRAAGYLPGKSAARCLVHFSQTCSQLHDYRLRAHARQAGHSTNTAALPPADSGSANRMHRRSAAAAQAGGGGGPASSSGPPSVRSTCRQ